VGQVIQQHLENISDEEKIKQQTANEYIN